MKWTVKRRFLILRFVVVTSCRYVWQSLKDCVKRILGREIYVDEHKVFFKQYLLHVIGLRPIRGITCAYQSGMEGAASQAEMVMNAINLAHASGLTYVHTPFTVIGHSDRPMPEWTAAWEALFNFGLGEVTCKSAVREVIDFSCASWDDVELCFGKGRQREQLIREFKATIPEFRRKYYWNKLPRVSHEVTVAVHIRRGDVPGTNPFMFTKTERILHTIVKMKSILASYEAPYTIRIYSEGKITDFQELSSLGAEFFLDADPLWTMQELIEADILVMAKSHFSYYAGIISDGIILFEPQTFAEDGDPFPTNWGRRLVSTPDDWLPCQSDGSFEYVEFRRKLDILMQAKQNQNCGDFGIAASRSWSFGAERQP